MDLDLGVTPIDTLYEWTGLVMAERFANTLLWGRSFVGILIAAAILRLFYLGQKKDHYFDLVAYPVYLAFMFFLISPVTVTVRPKNILYSRLWDETNLAQVTWGKSSYMKNVSAEDLQVRVPRIIGVTHKVLHAITRHLTTGMGNEVGYTLFRWQEVVAGLKQASILDPDLSDRFHTFLRYCYWPAFAAQGMPGDSAPQDKGAGWNLPLRELTQDPYIFLEMPLKGERVRCTQARTILDRDLWVHISTEKVHTQALAASHDLAAQAGLDLGEAYLTRLIYNETFGAGSKGEMALLRSSVPEYSSWDQKYMGTAKTKTLAQGTSGLLGLVSSFWEGGSHETLGPTLYYRLTLFAPYLYGLLQAVLLMAFPVAGLWSLWPGSWTAVLNFLKMWASIKIWPIFWSFLSAFNVYRLNLPPDDPLGAEGTGGSAPMFASIAAMYVLVPVLSFMVMNLVSQAGMLSISAFTGAGTGAGPAIGTIASGMSVAGKAGALAGKLARRSG
jgi:hypothetical protein